MVNLFPPLDPDLRPGGPRRRQVPFTVLLPNLVTLLAICAGLTAIRMAVEQRFDLAAAAIIFAIILDGIDGRLARYFRSTSKFGEQLDSLADFVDFGDASGFVSTSARGSSDVQGIAPSIVGTLPLGPVELFARAGMMFYEIDLNLTGGRVVDERADGRLRGAGFEVRPARFLRHPEDARRAVLVRILRVRALSLLRRQLGVHRLEGIGDVL